MVLALLSIYSNVSDVGKFTLILSAVYIYFTGKLTNFTEFGNCVKVEVAVLMSLTVSVDVKQH